MFSPCLDIKELIKTEVQKALIELTAEISGVQKQDEKKLNNDTESDDDGTAD